ncbi:hypothetical protein BFR81_03465 [Acinetobacter pittii]|nr:hypothetical protein BFR81_03465 [Acinetobacter pittii]
MNFAYQEKSLAEKLLNSFEVKLKRLYLSITLNIRTVETRTIKYRGKKLMMKKPYLACRYLKL